MIDLQVNLGGLHMISLATSPPEGAKIKVIGVGGGGGNAINNMIKRNLSGVDFIAANTDRQALNYNLANTTVQIGEAITRGLGAGADPEIGKKAVEETLEKIKTAIEGSDMLFVTAGMGGGTGTGGCPVIAKIGKEIGALVVGIVTKPFNWEGKKRQAIAEQGIAELRQHVDALIVIPNQKLLDIIDSKTSFSEAFQKVDEVLYNATRGIADIISDHGYVNVDFADVRTVMKGMGDAIMGIGTATGEHRAVEAMENALNSPLLDGVSISGAKGVLVNISGGCDLTMHEISDAVSIVEKAAGENAIIIHGVVNDDQPKDEIMVTVVATGFNRANVTSAQPANGSATKVNSAATDTVKPPFTKVGPPQTGPFTTFKGMGVKIEPQTATAEVPEGPKGHNNLTKYDQPAYERRGQVPAFKLGTATESFDKPPAYPPAQAIPLVKDHERPAFLRRIMD
jgi:cell division protein FtsZ